MKRRNSISRRGFLATAPAPLVATSLVGAEKAGAAQDLRRYLYVVTPGIRNYLEFGGAGIVVLDRDDGYSFVKRIRNAASDSPRPENIKGVCASVSLGRLYFTTPTAIYALDLPTEQIVWKKSPPDGCDRPSITPDGLTLYVPTFEKNHWHVLDAKSGEVLASLKTDSGAHNTVRSLDGQRMYLAGLKSPLLFVADTTKHELLRPVGPFSAAIRPFTINGQRTRAFCCVNGLLGFEIGDLESGRMIERIEIPGFSQGPVRRHGCPSHGIALTPDETEVWLCDAHHRRLHVFDNREPRPKLIASVPLRDEPGWITVSLDGNHIWSSTGEVIDAASKKIVARFAAEWGRELHSEKMIELHFAQNRLVTASDQFGVGKVR